MKLDDYITIEKIKEAIEISKKRLKEMDGPTNSFEAVSINNHSRKSNELHNILLQYISIYKRRLRINIVNDISKIVH